MKFTETELKGCFIIEPDVFKDERGYFFESFNQEKFELATGINTKFVQDNQSKSSFGVLRGLHFQKGEYAQAKLVRVIEGKILDVAVDLRKDSATFGNHFSIELSAENFKQLYIPRGFAHGFVVLSEKAVVAYKADNLYSFDNESGVIYSDEKLNIDWQIDKEKLVISEKDKKLKSLKAIAEEL